MDPIDQAAAHISAHEFVIETMMANWIADMSEEEGDRYLSDLCARGRNGWTAGEEDELTRQVLDESARVIDNLARKVSTRAAQIREARRRLRG